MSVCSWRKETDVGEATGAVQLWASPIPGDRTSFQDQGHVSGGDIGDFDDAGTG